MSLTPAEERAMPPAQRLAVLRAEMEARLACLEGGDEWRNHGSEIKWLAAKIWELERAALERLRTPPAAPPPTRPPGAGTVGPMKTAAEFVHAIYHSGFTSERDWLNAVVEREADARAEAFAESLMVIRGIASDHMTPALEQALAMLEKAIARRRSGS